MQRDSVLIIDDDDALATAMQFRLRAASFDVTRAARGREGLDLALADPPACVLLDLRMHGMNGYEILRELKGDSRTRATPVLVLSANVQEVSRRRVLDGGADGFMGKPYDAGELLSAIRRLIADAKEARVDEPGPHPSPAAG